MKCFITFVLSLVLLINATVSVPKQNIQVSVGQSVGTYRAVIMPDEVQQKLAAKGMTVTQHKIANLKNAPHVINSGTKLGTQPIDQEQKALAIYLEFPEDDQPPTAVSYEHIPTNLLQDLLFGESYNPYVMDQFSQFAEYQGTQAPLDRTLKNYYAGVSNNKITVTGNVVSVKMKGYSTYAIGQNYGVGEFAVNNSNGDYTMEMIFKDAIEAADAVVDFAEYAKDGVVPNIFLIHQGTGAEFSEDPEVIWSHSWDYISAFYYNRYTLTGRTDEDDLPNGIEVDGVVVNNYSIEPEVGGDITAYLGSVDGPYPPYVGVYAHEFGHVLGLPDQYDYGYDSKGIGAYTLMAGGSWSRYPNAWQYAGNSPVYLDAWSQVFMGLIVPQTVSDGTQKFTLKSLANGGGVVKIDVKGSSGTEYFLIENRQQSGFDSSLVRYGTGVYGLAIYHIDENVLARNFSRPNEAQNYFQSRKQNVKPDPITGETHYGIALIQADNRWDLEKNNNNADNGDLYKSKQSLTPTSTPNTGSYYLSNEGKGTLNNTNIFIDEIIENPDGSITFDVGYMK